MTGKRKNPGDKADNARTPEAEADASSEAAAKDAAGEESPEAGAPETVIDAEFSEEESTDEKSAADTEESSENDQAEASSDADSSDSASAEAAAGVAALALAAGVADKQEAERTAAQAEEKQGPGGLVYAWLALLTVCVVAALYILIVNPTYLRDRISLADAPELRAQANATQELGKAAEANAASITANEAAIAEAQTKLDDAVTAAQAAAATATKAVSLAEAAQTTAGEPEAALKASVAGVENKLSELEASIASVRSALVNSRRNGPAGDPIDGLALAAASEAAESALAAAEAAQAAAAAADSKSATATAGLNGRLDEISSKLSALGEQVAALEAKAAKRGPVSLAEAVLALQDLRTGVASGKPFAMLLGRAQAALPDAPELKDAPWVGYANSGLPTGEALTGEMQVHAQGIAQDALKAKLKTSDDSWLDRAVGGVVDRLKVRRVGAGVEGDDPAAVAARAEAALQEGDLATAIQEVETLEGAAAARFADWLKKAKATAAATNDLDAVQKAAIAAADGA